jgi:FixJ family two-component response regulator
MRLLLTDVVMSGIGGGLLWQTRSQRRPETKVIFMTGHTDDAVVRHGIDAAAVSFLQEPVSRDTLERCGACSTTAFGPQAERQNRHYADRRQLTRAETWLPD